MTKKAPKKEAASQPAIQINRSRGGGKKKPDLFARLRNDEHPLDRIIPIEIEFKPNETLDPNTIKKLDAQQPILLDAQPQTDLDAQLIKNWTSKPTKLGRPTTQQSDAQLNRDRTPNNLKPGRPGADKLGVKTPNSETWTPNSEGKLGVKTPAKKNLDAQESKKTEQRRSWEDNRATDRLALRPNREILKKFKVFCAEKDLGMTEFFELAGLKFVELDAQADNNLDVLTPIDDRRLKMMFKSKPFIINLYLRYNSIFNELAAGGGKAWAARWSPRDDEAAVRYNDVSPAIIELGILQTQIQKGFGTSRIQTFKYYTDEIEKALRSGVSDQMLEAILMYHRNIWNDQTGREIDLSFLETGNL